MNLTPVSNISKFKKRKITLHLDVCFNLINRSALAVNRWPMIVLILLYYTRVGVLLKLFLMLKL